MKRKVIEFIAARYLNLQVSQGIAGRPRRGGDRPGAHDVADLRSKLDALVAFRADAAFEPLAEVFKRAINITKAYSGPLDGVGAAVRDRRGKGAPRRGPGVSGRVAAAARDGRYGEAFREMAALQPLVAAFFEKVLVMAKDEAVRNNRLALLKGCPPPSLRWRIFPRWRLPGSSETLTGTGERRMATKRVYFFGGGKAEGSIAMKDVLGGKGAGLAEMTNLGLPVPPGFTIATEVCNGCSTRTAGSSPPTSRREIAANLAKLERAIGKKFGDPKNPLLVSVRSGARSSPCPG